MLRVINKPKATRSAFATATFNGEVAPEAEDTTVTKQKPNKRRGRNAANTNDAATPGQSNPKRIDNKDESYPCSACGETTHAFKNCFLVYGKERDWIPEESRETFAENMKNLLFRKRVEDQQKGKKKRKTQTQTQDNVAAE
ncbi:hypothetical protein MMC22_004565 [Lobaria immixta]|nr:hypothetical protein [Lobaria immixta]